MPQADQDALLTRLENYQAVGMSPKQAQVEAAKETLKRLEAEMPLVQHSARSPLGFYSALADGIESITTKQQAAGGWLAQIKGLVNKGAVKQDELEWSGLTDWLNLQAGKITKEQITGYLNANGVQVEETVLGDGDWAVYDGDYNQYFGSQSEAVAYAEEQGINVTDDTVFRATDRPGGYGTKFATYVVPGGQNYREVLLTLPEKTTADADRAAYEQWASRNGLSPNATASEDRYKRETGNTAPAPRTMTAMNADKAANYKSSH